MPCFDPATDPLSFRNALGAFATGVTLVTTHTAQGPIGITANSFASVSLDPPLVLWSVARSSGRYDAFAQADHFAIHILSAEQTDIARAFTTQADAFGDLTLAPHPEQVPLLDGCLARFECTREARHPAGDHDILVGRVTSVTTHPGAPLMFVGGQFRTG